MFPCQNPSICGVQNHRVADACKALKSQAKDFKSDLSSSIPAPTSASSGSPKKSDIDFFPVMYSAANSRGQVHSFPLSRVHVNHETRIAESGEVGTSKQLMNTAMGDYIDRYQNDPDFDEESLYETPPTKYVSDHLKFLAGWGDEEAQARTKFAYTESYKDAVDLVIQNHSDGIRDQNNEYYGRIRDARREYRDAWNSSGEYEGDAIEDSWNRNREQFSYYLGRKSN